MADSARALVIVGVPVDCVGAPAGDGADPAPFGTELSPAALRRTGVVSALGAADSGDLGVRLTSRVRDAATGVLGWPGVLTMTRAVRRKVGDVLAAGGFPVVVGGCCSLLPGALAGARDEVGPLALAYLDGHLDLYDGRTSPTGEPADMPMAVISGHGPYAWSAEVGAPVVAPGRTALVGPRDRDEAAGLGSVLPEQLGMARELTPADVRRAGAAATGATVAGLLVAPTGAAPGTGQYWVHLDVDVLDQDEFPATDYLMPGGLARGELSDMLGTLTDQAGLIGFSLGCYNPEKDPDGSSGRYLVDLLARTFAPGR